MRARRASCAPGVPPCGVRWDQRVRVGLRAPLVVRGWPRVGAMALLIRGILQPTWMRGWVLKVTGVERAGASAQRLRVALLVADAARCQSLDPVVTSTW